MKKQAMLSEELDNLLRSLTTVKAAEDSASEGKVENQGDSGTSHPSKSVDDGTQTAPTGSRAAENTSDVKKQSPGQSVDEAKEEKLDGASEGKLTTAKPTGEDPAHETASVSSTLDNESGKDSDNKDTEHPAKADFGGKYASLKAAAADVTDRANDFLAKTAALQLTPRKPVAKQADDKSDKKEDKKPAVPATMDASETCPDEEAGKKAAAQAASALGLDVDQQTLDLIKLSAARTAYDDVYRLASFYQGLTDGAAEKQAAAIVPNTAPKAPAVAKPAVKPAAKPVAAAPAVKMSSVAKSAKAVKIAAALIDAVETLAKRADEAGAEAMASGGDVGAPGAGAAPPPPAGGDQAPPPHAEPDGDESEVLQQVAQMLQQAGIDPQVLAQIPPEELAKALEMQGQGGAEGEEQPVAADQPAGAEAAA